MEPEATDGKQVFLDRLAPKHMASTMLNQNPPDSMQYYYLDSDGKVSAPVDEKQLLDLHGDGTVKDDTEVAPVGASDWMPYEKAFPPDAGEAPSPSPAGQTSDGPPVSSGGETPTKVKRKCQEIDYEILGDDIQLVEVELDPGETVIAEAGTMNYMEQGIEFEAKMGDGAKPDQGLLGKLLGTGKRALTGESIFMTHFTNKFGIRRRIAFGAPYPGKIAPLNMAKLGGEVFCQKDAFLCAALGTEVSIAFQKRLGTGFFGGEGFILQKLTGDGMAFVHAGGTIVKKELSGEILRVDTGCIVGFTGGVSYDIQMAGNLKSVFFGGEGLFLATLSGTGTVWLQSLPFSRMADRISSEASSSGK